MRVNRNLIAALLLCCTSMAVAASTCAADSQPPNIVLIMADDVSWECFGCYGAQDYQTPNIDALAAKGIRFDNCYSTPLCTPSRVKIMTGQYSFRNYTHFGYLNPKDKTFAHVLKSAGYKTAVAGKWQLNGLYHNADGCKDNTRPNHFGFDEYCLWQLTMTVNKRGDNMSERFWSPPLEQNGKILSVQENANQYGPDIMSDFVCDFIDRNRDGPFFVYYPSVLVHDPFVATPDTIGSADRDQKANLAPKGAPAKKRNFVAMVNYLDKLVGKIVRKVESVGQLDNTIILFTADNGTNVSITSRWNGQDIKGGKGSTKDMGNHVPMVAYWKGHTPAGTVSTDLVDFTDFYATFAEAAGVTRVTDDPIDGRSFYPQLCGQPGRPRAWQLCHYQPYWGRFSGRQYVRNQQFKLYRDGGFFNVPIDLNEANDLPPGTAGELAESNRRHLQLVLESVPPAPPNQGGRNAEHRPIYPDWKNIVDPND